MSDEVGSSSAVPPTIPPQSPTDGTTAATNAFQTPSFCFHRRPRLVDLITVLDRVTWAEIVVVYLLDNSFLRFALRSLVQAIYLMPKPAGFPERAGPPPSVISIAVSNLFCLILHTYNSAPESGEALRGYLHGSMILDFIGQLGPTSKGRLLSLDAIILVLQILTLGALVEKHKIDANKATGSTPGETEGNNQDHDAEERGERQGNSDYPDSIELTELHTTESHDEHAENSQPNPFMASDLIASGQSYVSNFYLMDIARQEHRVYTEHRDAIVRTEQASGGSRNGIGGFLHEMQLSRLQLRLPQS